VDAKLSLGFLGWKGVGCATREAGITLTRYCVTHGFEFRFLYHSQNVTAHAALGNVNLGQHAEYHARSEYNAGPEPGAAVYERTGVRFRGNGPLDYLAKVV
jgi:hypothetical protein